MTIDMSPEKKADYEAWLKTRPAKVQALAEEFPIGHAIEIDDDDILYVVGWTEDDVLVVSEVSPEQMYASRQAYEEAMERRQHICAQHLRDNKVKHA